VQIRTDECAKLNYGADNLNIFTIFKSCGGKFKHVIHFSDFPLNV